MSCDFDGESKDVEVEDIINIPTVVEAVADMSDTFEVEYSVASTSQRTRARPIRLQYYEVIGDDEVTPDGELVHFALLAGVEPINPREALNDKKWKSSMVEELQAIEINNT